jgi:hypothetical protein
MPSQDCFVTVEKPQDRSDGLQLFGHPDMLLNSLLDLLFGQKEFDQILSHMFHLQPLILQ